MIKLCNCCNSAPVSKNKLSEKALTKNNNILIFTLFIFYTLIFISAQASTLSLGLLDIYTIEDL